jgi:Luciferase-like monooxygenase
VGQLFIVGQVVVQGPGGDLGVALAELVDERGHDRADLIELAGRSADLVFTAQPDVPSGRRFRDSIRAAARRHGRDASSVLVLPGVAFVIGSTPASGSSRMYFRPR